MGGVLCLGGSDPEQGAGVQMDGAVCQALGREPHVVVAVDTVQGEEGLEAASPRDQVEVAHRILYALDHGVDAIKIGALGDEHVVAAVAATLEPWHEDVPIVLDPVCAATRAVGNARLNTVAGSRLMEEELFPLCRVVTPNTFEFGTGERYRDCRTVLLKGGHAGDFAELGGGPPAAWVTDLLEDRVMSPIEFRHPRIDGASGLHGTGCALSSAIACFLAKGYEPWAACQCAIEVMHEWLGEAVAGDTGLRPHAPARMPEPRILPRESGTQVMWLCGTDT
jgi:hydroxymethylpyrimidine/phosphomethylpyrimidine kinase